MFVLELFPAGRKGQIAHLFFPFKIDEGIRRPATSADGAKTGLPLNDHHAAVLAAVGVYQKRLAALSELRAKEGRVLSGENRKRIEDAIGSLKEATDALQGLLAATEPKAAPVPAPTIATPETISQLYAQYQRTLASINGVRL